MSRVPTPNAVPGTYSRHDIVPIILLENPINNVRTDRSTSTKDSYYKSALRSSCIIDNMDLPALPIFLPNFFPFALSLLSGLGVEPLLL